MRIFSLFSVSTVYNAAILYVHYYCVRTHTLPQRDTRNASFVILNCEIEIDRYFNGYQGRYVMSQ